MLQVDAHFQQTGTSLRSPVELDLSMQKHWDLCQEWGAVVVHQYHGQIVQVLMAAAVFGSLFKLRLF